MLLKFRPFVPSREWSFIDPDTSYKYQANSRDALVKLIVTYREQNQLEPISEIDLVLDNYLCHLPCNIGSCIPVKGMSRSLYKYVKGGVVLLSNLWIKNPVTQETADERGAQCVTCPHNIFPDKTRFIRYSDRIAEAAVGKKKSIHHVNLGSCEVCTCTLKAKVWTNPPFHLSAEEREKMSAVNCWQTK